MFTYAVKKTNNKGFSLVELMVVVAIIGVLATLAIPNIQKYIAKSRQSEAKTNLSTVYTSEKAFFAEYSIYDTRFGAIGYIPEGKLRYNVGFNAAGVQAGVANGYSLPPAITAISAQGYCVAPGINMTATVNCQMQNGATNAAPNAVSAAVCTATGAAAAGCQTTNTSFQAGANSTLTASAGVDDWWAIDNAKELRQTQDGIR
jgi:type IV pilus assembly protein PilA